MIKPICLAMCLFWHSAIWASMPTRSATQKEINASKSDLMPSMRVSITDYDSDGEFNGELQKFLLGHDLDLLTCFTALENKSLVMPKGQLSLRIMLNLDSKVSVNNIIGIQPEQTSQNHKDLSACIKEKISKKSYSTERKPKKEKSEVVLSFMYSMPNE